MIFAGQTAVRLILRTKVNFLINPPSIAYIKIKNPDKSISEWQADYIPDENGYIYVDFSDAVKFDLPGKYQLWAYMVFSDGRTGIGRKIEIFIEE